MNSPKLYQPGCTDDAQMYGGFGGEPYPSERSSGIKSLQSLLNPPIGGKRLSPCPVGPEAKMVALGDGVHLPSYSGIEVCALEWQERGWDVAIEGSTYPLQPQLPELEQIVNMVQTSRLPAAHGVVDVAEAADGQHSVIYWVQGKALYWVSQYHSTSLAFQLVSSVATAVP